MAERSGARTEKGAGWKWEHARGGGSGKEFVGEGFILLMEAVPGGKSFLPASERSEHRCFQGGRRTKFAGWG
ncbi:MAG TPA: hypothetical protein DDW74_03830 [Porphyromonadaceae bacterium]|nr:hypothetical protein [Porphyromonadaceae bacterium]